MGGPMLPNQPGLINPLSRQTSISSSNNSSNNNLVGLASNQRNFNLYQLFNFFNQNQISLF